MLVESSWGPRESQCWDWEEKKSGSLGNSKMGLERNKARGSRKLKFGIRD